VKQKLQKLKKQKQKQKRKELQDLQKLNFLNQNGIFKIMMEINKLLLKLKQLNKQFIFVNVMNAILKLKENLIQLL